MLKNSCRKCLLLFDKLGQMMYKLAYTQHFEIPLPNLLNVMKGRGRGFEILDGIMKIRSVLAASLEISGYRF